MDKRTEPLVMDKRTEPKAAHAPIPPRLPSTLAALPCPPQRPVCATHSLRPASVLPSTYISLLAAFASLVPPPDSLRRPPSRGKTIRIAVRANGNHRNENLKAPVAASGRHPSLAWHPSRLPLLSLSLSLTHTHTHSLSLSLVPGCRAAASPRTR